MFVSRERLLYHNGKDFVLELCKSQENEVRDRTSGGEDLVGSRGNGAAFLAEQYGDTVQLPGLWDFE